MTYMITSNLYTYLLLQILTYIVMDCIFVHMYDYSHTYIYIYTYIYIHRYGYVFFDVFKVLKGKEVEAPRIIPPNHTQNHTLESYPMNSSVGNIPGFQD